MPRSQFALPKSDPSLRRTLPWGDQPNAIGQPFEVDDQSAAYIDELTPMSIDWVGCAAKGLTWAEAVNLWDDARLPKAIMSAATRDIGSTRTWTNNRILQSANVSSVTHLLNASRAIDRATSHRMGAIHIPIR